MAKTKTSTALVKWDEELAKQAQIATQTEAGVGGGSFLGTAQGILKYQGAEVPNNELNVVVVDHILENALYEGAYDPDNPQPPVCFAFGRTEEEMAPHPDSAKPQGDAEGKCAGCQWNVWGSADVGRGKACKNIRRLELITEGDLEDIPGAEVAFLKLPVTSVKAWAGYVRQLATNYQRPPLGVVTTIKEIPDAKSQFKIVTSLAGVIEDGEVIGQLLEKQKANEEALFQPYAAAAEAPARAPKVPAKRAAMASPAPRQAVIANPVGLGKTKLAPAPLPPKGRKF